jgi:uncharacterized phage protein gp47/JayE
MTQEEILSRLLSNISSEFDKSVGSFFYDTQKPLAIELESIYEKLEEILLNGFAATAKGEYLDNKVAEQGLIRKPATYATGSVTVMGTRGAVISKGDKVASDTLVFTVLETKYIEGSGTIIVSVECDTPGKIGNVPIGAINKFPVTISGLVSVTNETAATGGYDAETDDDLRQRYFEKVSAPVSSGNKYHYINWAKEVVGVGDIKVIPLWGGPGTVKVIIINSNGGIADTSLINEVTDKIEENRPIGASVTVESAVPIEINVSTTLTLQDNVTLEEVTPKIEVLIETYLKRTAFTQDYISYAHIGGAILSVDGVLDYTDLMVNGGTQNISIAENEVAVLGEVTLR